MADNKDILKGAAKVVTGLVAAGVAVVTGKEGAKNIKKYADEVTKNKK
ncbi:hypothetical protein JCM16358_20450 [Halanaerocella petrolearia]